MLLRRAARRCLQMRASVTTYEVNVRCRDAVVGERYRKWLKEDHIPKVLASGPGPLA